MNPNNNNTNFSDSAMLEGSRADFQEPKISSDQHTAPEPLNQTVNPLVGSPKMPSGESLNPMPVVRVLSPRGVEYVFLIVTLFTAAISLIGAIISLIEGQTSFNVLAYPTAALIVSLPTFALLFLRLKKAEVNDPDSRLDPSKRRSTQFTQIVSFLVCFFVLIGTISAIFAKMSGTFSGSVVKLLLDALVVEIVIGGILFYYWRDEHRRT